MDVNKRPQRKKNIPLRFQDSKETKSKKMGISSNSEVKKIKIHDVKEDDLSKETEVDLSKEKEAHHFSMNLVPPSQFCKESFQANS